MTLLEVIVAFAISGLAVAGIVSGYMTSVRASEKFALSQAANALAAQEVEIMRSAVWTTTTSPAVDQLGITNFTTQPLTLDLSGSGSGVTYATNFVQVTTVSTSPPLRRIHVDCVWSYYGGQVLTNSIETMRGPDQ
jgi:type II secretory pathway pseudopilin PulG